MELIINKEGFIHCNECRVINTVCAVMFEDARGYKKLCEKCLTKALLMIRPIELKSMDGADILGYLEMVVEYNIIRNAEEKHLKDMRAFLEWVKQILETKK